jgi:hypothetical protein
MDLESTPESAPESAVPDPESAPAPTTNKGESPESPGSPESPESAAEEVQDRSEPVRDPEADHEPAPDLAAERPAPEERPAPQRAVSAKRWPLMVCAVLAAIGFAGTGYFGRYWLNDRSTSSQVNQVRAATSNFVRDLTNFNPGNIDSDFTNIQALATGTFANQAHQYFGSPIRNQLTAAHAGSRGQVRDLFIESLANGQADVFVVVDQDYTNSSMNSEVSDTLRLEIGLNDTSAGWKVSSVNVLQSPSGFAGGTPSAVSTRSGG